MATLGLIPEAIHKYPQVSSIASEDLSSLIALLGMFHQLGVFR